ncbi:MAG: hypothetical protein QRY74_05665 [Chlamydia sp.]
MRCSNYFKGFEELSTFNTNSSSKNVLGILKTASYFTVVIPLFIGLIYRISSLIGRVSVGDSRSPENQKISSVSQKTFGITFEEELKQLFNSSIKTQKIFTIDGAKIAIIFNPLREALKVGFYDSKRRYSISL